MTVTWFLVGAIAGGAAIGAVLGAAGAAAGVGRWGTTAPVALLAVLAVVGAALDLRVVGALPTTRRQVREAWLREYRGWVYGLGFGFQLGLALVTVVNTSLVYLALTAAFLSGSVVGGVLVGASFGLVRWLTVLPAAAVDRPTRLALMTRRIESLDRPSAQAAVVFQLSSSTLAVLATTLM